MPDLSLIQKCKLRTQDEYFMPLPWSFGIVRSLLFLKSQCAVIPAGIGCRTQP